MQRTVLFLIVVIYLVMGCSPIHRAADTVSGHCMDVSADIGIESISVPFQQPNGNRIIEGQFLWDYTTVNEISVPLSKAPEWIVATSVSDGVALAYVLADGTTGGYWVGLDSTAAKEWPVISPSGTASPLSNSTMTSSVAPPVFFVGDGEGRFMEAPDDMSIHSVAALLPGSGLLAYVSAQGNVRIAGPNGICDVNIKPLPDARILQDDNGRIALLVNPTDRYDHAVLGDGLEGEGIGIISTTDSINVETVITARSPAVIEGLAPIWIDFDRDGELEFVVTLSDYEGGARLAIIGEDGSVEAQGPPVGHGHRWRHPIGVFFNETNQKNTLVVVSMPHGPGPVEMYEQHGDELVIVSAAETGYTSHTMHSRNLEMGLMADMTGDRIPELLLPHPDMTHMGVIGLIPEPSVSGVIQLHGKLSSNVAAAALPDGRMVLAAGVDSPAIRLWISSSPPRPTQR